MMCAKAAEPCKAPTAVYFHQSIFYDETLDLEQEYPRSIIVHEMVQYMQDRAGWSQTDCVNRVVREYDAYKVQYQYLLDRGIDMPQVQWGVRAEKYCLEHPEK